MNPTLPTFFKDIIIPSLFQLKECDHSTFSLALSEVHNNLLFILENYSKSDDLTLLVGRIANLVAAYNTNHNDEMILSIIDLSDSFSQHHNLNVFLYELLNLQYSSIPKINPLLH